MRCVCPSHPSTAGWFEGGPAGGRWRALQHLVTHTRLTLDMLEQLDLINRTAELAKTFGIDFYSVLSRGSQYRVESMVLRLAHTQNFLCVSPTREQVRGSRVGGWRGRGRRVVAGGCPHRTPVPSCARGWRAPVRVRRALIGG